MCLLVDKRLAYHSALWSQILCDPEQIMRAAVIAFTGVDFMTKIKSQTAVIQIIKLSDKWACMCILPVHGA